jgi:hypothetical protein
LNPAPLYEQDFLFLCFKKIIKQLLLWEEVIKEPKKVKYLQAAMEIQDLDQVHQLMLQILK